MRRIPVETLFEMRDALIEFVLFSSRYISKSSRYYIKNERSFVSHRDIQHREESSKYDAQRSIFDDIRGVWIAGETLSRVFDTSQ